MSKFRNAFSRSRVSGDVLDARTASVGVHKSLFSNLQQIGFDGSASALIAWAMVKSVRPKMADSKSALRDIGERSVGELIELREAAVKTSRSEKTSSSPGRAELIGDIVAMLDGFISRASDIAPLQPSHVSGVAPRAPRLPGMPTRDEIARVLTRAKELEASGLDIEAANMQAGQEILGS